MIDKQLIRKQVQNKRDSLSLTEKSTLDRNLCNILIKLIDAKKTKVVHTYLPIKSEVNIYPVIDYMLSNNITVVAPKALPGMEMSNLILSSLSDLENGVFGTKHPTGNNIYHGQYDIIIVPGLAFDKNNNRIGYGGGYYDMFLKSNQKALKVALAYPFQVFNEIPFEFHDEKLDLIIY